MRLVGEELREQAAFPDPASPGEHKQLRPPALPAIGKLSKLHLAVDELGLHAQPALAHIKLIVFSVIHERAASNDGYGGAGPAETVNSARPHQCRRLPGHR